MMLRTRLAPLLRHHQAAAPRRMLSSNADADALTRMVVQAAGAGSGEAAKVAFYSRMVASMEKEHAQALAAALMRMPQNNLDAAFKAADSDSDGVLSKHEFIKWVETHRPIMAETVETLANAATPAFKQLFFLGLASAVPFVGFGFMDNFGMIIFGEYIDSTLGVALGLSTMMAAGLGNAVADVVGISFGQTIEAISAKLGLPDPQLSDVQRRLPSARWARALGTSIGLGTGCLLGLVPLYFMEKHEKAEKERKSHGGDAKKTAA